MNRQLIILTIALVTSILGSTHHNNKREYEYPVGTAGRSFLTNAHHQQHSNINAAYNSGSEYQQNLYDTHSGRSQSSNGNGYMNSGSHYMGSGSHNLNGGGLSHGELNQGEMGQWELDQSGLNQGSLQNQQQFKSAGDFDGGSLNIATDFPKKNDDAIVFGNQPNIGSSWSNGQQPTGMYERGLSESLRNKSPLPSSTSWGSDPSRKYRKISASALLPISYNNERESNNVQQQQTILNGSTSNHESHN